MLKIAQGFCCFGYSVQTRDETLPRVYCASFSRRSNRHDISKDWSSTLLGLPFSELLFGWASWIMRTSLLEALAWCN